MKKRLLFVLVTICSVFCGCEPYISGEPGTSTSTSKSHLVRGFLSTFTYREMPYTGDSIVLIFNVEEVDSVTQHYKKAELYNGSVLMAESDTLPYVAEITVPIIDDSTFVFEHVCTVDSVVEVKDRVKQEIYIHKSEVVNQTPDVKGITLIIDLTTQAEASTDIH